MHNRLYYGDNLNILRSSEHFPDACIDLIYLDPPFNSSRNYNVLFKSESGADSEAQITAFEDTWHWGRTAEATYRDLILNAPPKVSTATEALMALIDRNQMMAYLVMMTARLVELQRILKPTGSLYLHCDPTASHYLKILLDAIFAAENFRSHITWKRTSSHNNAKKWGPNSDNILFYTKSDDYVWNRVYHEYEQEYIDANFRHKDDRGRYSVENLTGAGTVQGDSGKLWRGVNPTAAGRHWAVPNAALQNAYPELDLSPLTTQEKLDLLDAAGLVYWPPRGKIPRQKRYLDEAKGVPIQEIITDIRPLSSQAKERLGYPTQKPTALLERIIRASSREGDIVLDPFCGCGTAIAAAHQLKRRWIGIDITHLSISLQKYRLSDMFELRSGVDYEVIGEPTTVAAARALAQDSANDGRYQFEWWALSLVNAKPAGAPAGSSRGKKGADSGIDGVINFFEPTEKSRPKVQKVIVQVKSGKVKVGDIRDLKGALQREQAAIAVFITLSPPTAAMEKEALSAGSYQSPFWEKHYPQLQILTIAALLDGAEVDMPPQHGTHRQAQRYTPDSITREGKTQQDLM